jgi:hypothetical protein
MRLSIKLLLCCICLAGCAEAEAEVAAKAVDFSKPVLPHTIFVECGPLEGITMYPVPLAGKYTVEGKYRLSSSRNDLSVTDYSDDKMVIWGTGAPVSDERVIVKIPDNLNDREAGINANFFLHGLVNGCTGVFAADEVVLMGTARMLRSAWERGLTHSQVVDDAYRAFDSDPRTGTAVHKNAVFMDVHAWEGPRVAGVTSFMVLNGEVYGSEIIRLDE